jgi:DMSO/TMAO reductase YedYZ molybdopterin-dependent catalytic subunit
MPSPWANTALLLLVPLAIASGVGGVVSGSPGRAWVLVLHAIVAYALLATLAFKTPIVLRSLRRRRPDRTRLAFVGMSALLVAVLATGVAWVALGRVLVGGISLINVHAYLAIALAVPFAVHLAARYVALRIPRAHGRGAFLRVAGLGVLGVAGWQAADAIGRRRRFTGSYETGSLSGVFPEVRWLLDDPEAVDLGSWQLVIDGAVRQPLAIGYGDLLARATSTRREIIDCTGGWWSEQDWQGVALADLLREAGLQDGARSVEIASVTGFSRRFALADAQAMLLATGCAGRPLEHGHGRPARLVAAERRGYDWVKWVRQIRVLESDERWQSPLPLQ